MSPGRTGTVISKTETMVNGSERERRTPNAEPPWNGAGCPTSNKCKVEALRS
jgi:hypothetical protein